MDALNRTDNILYGEKARTGRVYMGARDVANPSQARSRRDARRDLAAKKKAWRHVGGGLHAGKTYTAKEI